MINCPRVLVVAFLASSFAKAEERVVTVQVPGSAETLIAKSGPSGVTHVLYYSEHEPMYARTRDGGRSFSEPVSIVDEASRREGLEYHVWDMAVDSSDRVHIALGNNAWQLKLPRDQWGFFYTRLEPGAERFENLRNINKTPSEGFSLAVAKDGRVSAIWMADKLFAKVSKDHGRTFGLPAEIDASLDPCDCCTTSSTYAADGRLGVLYREETDNERDMYLAMWNQDNGQVVRTRISTTPWKINACPMTFYQISRNSKGFTAVWPTKSHVYFARLNGNGQPVSPVEIKVPGTTEMRTSILTLDATDGTLVVWKNSEQLHWQMYDHKGLPTSLRGSESSPGKGVAGVVSTSGQFTLFR